MMQINDKERPSEVLYKFYLPDNNDELVLFQNAKTMASVLHDVKNMCFTAIKVDDTSSEDLARQILLCISEVPIDDI